MGTASEILGPDRLRRGLLSLDRVLVLLPNYTGLGDKLVTSDFVSFREF